jgi:Cdc6-like AAA superfamily ATPase
MASLKAFDCESYRDKLLRKRHENTCNWLLTDQRYTRWLENDKHTILWIHGGPGCGKSVISSFLTKALYRNEKIRLWEDYMVVYFFCDDKDEKLRTAHAMLSNVLAQLLKQEPEVLVHFCSEAEYDLKKEKTVWSFGMLWRVFERILRDHKVRPMCVIIDALGKQSQLN